MRGKNNEVEKLSCVNQSHFMQMMDGWGFQTVLHYSREEGMECAIYCHAMGADQAAANDICLAVTSANHNGQPVKVQELAKFVREHYMEAAHPPP